MTVLMAWSHDDLRYDSIASGTASVAMKYDSIARQLNIIGMRIDSLTMRIDKMVQRRDSLDQEEYWKQVIFRRGWSINDTSIVYPR